MKLLELLQKLEKENTALEMEAGVESSMFTLDSKALQSIESELFECDEFKKVVRLNYLALPSYLVDKESGEPISVNRDFIGGDTDYRNVSSFIVKDDTPIVFGKFVDLYTITACKHFNVNAEIKKPGIWVFPTEYNLDKGEAIQQVRVIWNQEQIEMALAYTNQKDSVRDRLVRMFETALDNMKPNIECTYSIKIRCSARSILQGTVENYDFKNGFIETPFMSDIEAK